MSLPVNNYYIGLKVPVTPEINYYNTGALTIIARCKHLHSNVKIPVSVPIDRGGSNFQTAILLVIL